MWVSAFGWLASLFENFGSLIPQYIHHEWTNVAVSIKRGKRRKVLRYGINFYWPFWTEVYTRACTQQTKRIPNQTLTTKDGHRITSGGVVRYHIDRDDKEAILQALCETDDVDRVIMDEALAVFCEFITDNDWEELRGNRRKVNTLITRACRTALKPYGVYVDRAQITNLSKCSTLALVKIDTGYEESNEEGE